MKHALRRGSWAVLGGGISPPLTKVTTIFILLITLIIITHEPASDQLPKAGLLFLDRFLAFKRSLFRGGVLALNDLPAHLGGMAAADEGEPSNPKPLNTKP